VTTTATEVVGGLAVVGGGLTGTEVDVEVVVAGRKVALGARVDEPVLVVVDSPVEGDVAAVVVGPTTVLVGEPRPHDAAAIPNITRADNARFGITISS
jgi:hypothetical protein